MQLLANSEHHFYATFEFFNIYFNEENGKTTGLRMEVYGKEFLLKKTN